jgi:hypothetical protein
MIRSGEHRKLRMGRKRNTHGMLGPDNIVVSDQE